MCLLRQNNSSAEVPARHSAAKIKQKKRIPKKRTFFSTFASEAEVDSALNSTEKVQWHLPLHLGGTRRGTRLRNSISTESAIKSILLSIPLNKLRILRDDIDMPELDDVTDSESDEDEPATAVVLDSATEVVDEPDPAATPAAPAAPAAHATRVKRTTIDNILGRKKKRRLIQLTYEILGCPPETYPNGVSRWEGKSGTISVIHEYLGLESGRVRAQIRAMYRSKGLQERVT